MRSLVVVALLFGLTGSAVADNKADELFEQGKRLLAKKDYANACTAFEQSFATEPAIGTQANIGLCYEKWGKWPAAYKAYSKAARMARDANDDRFTGLRTHAERAGRKVARLAVRIPIDADERATYTIDGKQVERATFSEELVLDPGKHTITARVPNQSTVQEEVELGAGVRELVQLEVPRGGSRVATSSRPPTKETPKANEPVTPAEQPTEKPTHEQVAPAPPTPEAAPRRRGRLYGGIVLAAGGGAAIGIASYVALGARADYKAAAEMCPGGMCATPEAHEATSDARARARTMTYVFAGGVGLAAVGVYLIATSRGGRPKDSDVSASIFVGDGAAGFVIGGAL